MAHPTARVLAALELLQTHGRLSGAELARRLEVDVRTVRRYVAVLEELGIPVTAERGRHGAYSLVPGFKLPPMMFTGEEALALSVGLVAARDLGLSGAGPAVASAQAKLERVMPAGLRRRVRAVGESVVIDLRRGSPGSDAALAAMTEAAQDRRRVRLRYRAGDGTETRRDFDAYGLTWRGGLWYAIGRCHLRQGVRSFRLDRVLAVEPLEAGFTRPADFDPLAHLVRSLATLPRAFAPEVLLETDLATARRELFEAVGLLQPVEGGVLLSAQAGDLDWFARELARLPFPFRILRPAALRTALARHAERLRRPRPPAPVSTASRRGEGTGPAPRSARG